MKVKKISLFKTNKTVVKNWHANVIEYIHIFKMATVCGHIGFQISQ